MKKVLVILLIALSVFTFVSCDHEVGSTANNSSNNGGNVPTTGISFDKTSLTVAVGGNGTITVTVSPTNATNKNVTWTTSAESVATVTAGVVSGIAEGTATITATAEDGNYTATCTVTVVKTTGSAGITGGGTESWVQLWAGGPKWAEFNVGSTISSYSGVTAYTTANVGGLYMWGGIQDHRPAVQSSDYQTGSLSLDSTHDAATAIWGSNWKTPTKTDLSNLIAGITTLSTSSATTGTNTKWEWIDGCTKHIDDNGTTQGSCTLAGWKVSGIQAGYTGNSIFLVAAGYVDLNAQTPSVVETGKDGKYMASTSDGSFCDSLSFNDKTGKLGGSASYVNASLSVHTTFSVRAILAE